jgi:hypothetical protein
MSDARWADPREYGERDGRPRVYDERDRDDHDPRDGLMHDLDLPRGEERELVVDRDRAYELNGEDTRILAAAGAFRVRERCLADCSDVPEMVFATDSGQYLDVGNLRRAFYRVLTAAGLRRIRFHDLRHTFASLLIQQGESLAYVRDQMGHASIQITVDTYGHMVPGGNRAAVDRLDDETQLDATPAQPGGVSKGSEWPQVVGGPPGDRTRDTLIKSQVLYH